MFRSYLFLAVLAFVAAVACRPGTRAGLLLKGCVSFGEEKGEGESSVRSFYV